MAPQTLTEESTSRYVQAGSIRLHYNEAGTGEPVVCLHGGSPGASGWSEFEANVGPLSKSFRTLLLDAPQYGKSDVVAIDGERYLFHARVVRDMLDALNIEKAHLVGSSLGGATALAFAIEYPERTGKLVVVGPAAGPSFFMPRPLEGIKLLNGFWSNPTKEAMRKIIEVSVYDQKFRNEELVERRFQAAVENFRVRKLWLGDYGLVPNVGLPAQRDFTGDLSKVQAKTLVVWGRDDRFTPLDYALLLLWRIPNAQAHIFSQCGHWCQYEKAGEFNSLVLDFLRDP